MSKKILRIKNTVDDPKSSWIERYYVRSKSGRYHELTKIPGDHQYAPGSEELLTWFLDLGVTHVEVTEGWHETVPAKTYPISAFSRHLRRISEED